jgi:ferrous iron transport protein B
MNDPTPARSPAGRRPDATLLVALAGQPNVGKSTVFNLLTGLSQHVGNWPGKTVERKEGVFVRNGERVRIVDLPGTYGLTARSVEEQVARDFIIHERPDVVIVVADASVLERNLYLVAELLAIGVPLVLGLNMMDVAEAQGIQVEPRVLAAALGLPVVPLVATRNLGVSDLVDAAVRLASDPSSQRPSRPDMTGPHWEVLARLRALLAERVPEPYDPAWVALKLLEGDVEMTGRARAWAGDDIWREVDALLEAHEDAIVDITSGRYDWIARMVRAAVRRPRLRQVNFTDRFDRVAVHPLWGLFVLLGAFGLVFWVTFVVAAPVQSWLDVHVVGRLQGGLARALAGSPAWLAGLVVDGVLGGVGIVLTFLPVLVVFFGALGLLEDTGYLTRAAYLTDRFMHVLGLHGKSCLALCLGFGCNVPAVIGARMVEARSGRLLTILLTPFVPCSARLMVLAFLAPVFFGRGALLVSWSLIALNLLVLALVGVAASRTLFRGRHMAFIMELPLYHLPNARTILAFIWGHVLEFLRSAASIILIVSVMVWAAASFPGPGIETSYLARFGRSLAPAGALMGFDWRLIVALVSSFVARENAIATLAILYGGGVPGTDLAQTLAAHVAPASGLAFLTVTMLFVPCVATVAAMRQETRSWRWPLFSVLLHLVVALAAGSLVYQAARWLGLGR